MSISRKDFFKKSCLTGLCLCGFSSIALTINNSENAKSITAVQDDSQVLVQEWLSNLLSNISDTMDEEAKKKILKSCSNIHYNNLKMDDMLTDYEGKLERFIDFIEEKWGWKIEYNQVTKTLIADENKNYCVCPMVSKVKETKLPALCYCSEGFAEKMFSKVVGQPVTANVISSIQRGDKSCKYKITFS